MKDWKNELARFIHSTRKSDTRTWTRQSRRIPGLPGWSREIETHHSAICIDTSGSIVGSTMNAFVAECRAILDLSASPLWLSLRMQPYHKSFNRENRFPLRSKAVAVSHLRSGIEGSGEIRTQRNCLFHPRRWHVPAEFSVSSVMGALTKPHAVPFGEKILVEAA